MSDAADIATTVLALAALGVSLHELRAAGRERRISVRPHIAFTREASSEKRTFRILMRNTGLGPAEIVQFSYTLDGKHHFIAQEANIEPLLKSAGIDGCHIDYFAGHITAGDYFPVSGELRVIDLSEIRPYPEREGLFNECFANLSVHVKYRSLYGDNFVASADV